MKSYISVIGVIGVLCRPAELEEDSAGRNKMLRYEEVNDKNLRAKDRRMELYEYQSRE